MIQTAESYTTPSAVSYTLQTESTYDWKNEQWSVPIGAIVSKVTSLGGQLVSISGGIRYWADSPESGPEGWAGRLVLTLLFPK